jgi:hypothetical protein
VEFNYIMCTAESIVDDIRMLPPKSDTLNLGVEMAFVIAESKKKKYEVIGDRLCTALS